MKKLFRGLYKKCIQDSLELLEEIEERKRLEEIVEKVHRIIVRQRERE